MFCFWQAYDIILNVFFLCIVGFGRHEMLMLSAIFFFGFTRLGYLDVGSWNKKLQLSIILFCLISVIFLDLQGIYFSMLAV